MTSAHACWRWVSGHPAAGDICRLCSCLCAKHLHAEAAMHAWESLYDTHACEEHLCPIPPPGGHKVEQVTVELTWVWVCGRHA